MPTISLANIHHTYGSGKKALEVLHGIERLFTGGKAYALLGPSGCGKTTLLNILSGLLTPSGGKVYMNDDDITSLPPERRNIAQVFQFPVVYESMRVYDNLAFPLRARNYKRADVDKIVMRIAEVLELKNVLHNKAGGLGIATKQVVALGRGLVRHDVNAILLDEALTAVDPYEKWVFRRKLKKLQRNAHHSMIYVTHDQSEALTFADEVIVMNEGRVVQADTPEQLFERPAKRFVGYFIGSPGMNFLPAPHADHYLHVAGHPFIKMDTPLYQAVAKQGAATLELGIRPEYVTVSQTTTALKQVGKHVLNMPARVKKVTALGSVKLVEVTLGNNSGAQDVSLVAKVPDRTQLATELSVGFPVAKLCFYIKGTLVGVGEGTVLRHI